MPIDYRHYPTDWLSTIRPRILERESHCCKFCGIADRLVGWWVAGGAFYTADQASSGRIPPQDAAALLKKKKHRPEPYQLVLTVAHLDHKLIDHSDGNLAALCQRCHLNHDRASTARQRAQSRRYSRRKKQLRFAFLQI